MRKNFQFSAIAVVVFLVIQNVPLAQSQLAAGQPSRSRADRKVTRLHALSRDANEPGFRYADISDQESSENDQESSENTDRFLLTGAEDTISPMPEQTNSYAPCYVECREFWEHRNAVWGEYLYLRPRGADVTYATPVDGTLSTSVPVGPQAVAAFGYDSGFRIGGAWAIDRCSSFTANYTGYQASTSDNVSLAGGTSFLRAETVHPSTVNVTADSLAAQALYDFNLQSVDLNYKAILWGGDSYVVNYVAGLRYSGVEQQFGARYAILGTTTVNTNVDFHGVGPRFGLEAERLLGDYGLLLYSKGYVNFLAGSNSADYLQTNILSGIVTVHGHGSSDGIGC